jgi:SNF2 family DNA or RNA helicase
MTQLVVPIKMSVLQKEVYRAIMGKDPELLEQIIFKPGQQTSPAHRAKLNNLLMQLRKCLCHPYQYSKAVDPNSADPEVWIRDMIDASSKFQFLEVLLPKLRERKHRVLIFSQFLEQLDLLEELLEYLGLRFQRIDGNVDALDKQERIDEFNAPDSELFAFLLSTRAGGVGINLATADTVIIMVRSSSRPIKQALT